MGLTENVTPFYLAARFLDYAPKQLALRIVEKKWGAMLILR